MMKVAPPPPPPRVNNELVSQLERYLELARKGDMQAMAFSGITATGSYRTSCSYGGESMFSLHAATQFLVRRIERAIDREIVESET